MDCPHLGELTIDVSYGGNFYAIVDVQENYKGLEHYTVYQLISWSRTIRKAINAAHTLYIQRTQILGVAAICCGPQQQP